MASRRREQDSRNYGKTALELTKIGDMILGDRLWPREELENWIRRHEGLNWRHRDGEVWIVKILSTLGRAESYLRVVEVLDEFEELWRCIPNHIREGALREDEEQSKRGARC